MQSATLPSLSRETILQSNSQDSTPAPSRTSQSIETRHQAGIKTISQHKPKQNTAATQHTSQTQKNALPFLPLSHSANPFHQIEPVQPKHKSTLNKAQVILLSQLLTNNRTTPYSTPKTAPLPVRSSIATTPCRNMCSNLQTHIIRQARIEVTAAYALNHLELQVLKPSKLLQDFVYLRQDPRNPASPQFLNTLIGTVLYNAIKEYHDDGTRKTIHFHSHTVEDNYNAIREKSNVTVLDDHHDNDVNNILMKYTDNKRQRYNTLIEDYNRAGKREDNILTVDECRTGHSNKKDIEANEREEETRVQLRKSSEEIHDILLREFRRANDFTESVTHNDDEQDEFAMLAEEYTIDNRIIHALPEDCDALVERYEEEINYSDLYSTM
ncbi:hypothetical protein HBI89_252310 [Parastagonospora nodorum]|nr:hypothetical protein HBI90_068230 [Parastagonospora nodorum]KAH5888380.1 hypothetical protein HBI89_252310 [Parastagonospora nodorum]